MAPRVETARSQNSEVDLRWLFNLIDILYSRGEKVQQKVIDYESLPHFLTQLREAYERFRMGNTLALLDALRICAQEEVPLPDWVSAGVQEFMVDSVLGAPQGKRGRSNSIAARTRESVKKYVRYETVRQIRTAQKHEADGPRLIYLLALPRETTKLLKSGKITSVGRTVADAIEIAELSLRGTFAQASFATIENVWSSYVEDEFLVSHETQVLLGLASNDPPELLDGLEFLTIEELANTSPEQWRGTPEK